MMYQNSKETTAIWRQWLDYLIRYGRDEKPRSMWTKAEYDQQLVFDPTKPIVMPVGRRLNYRFMFAEAYWILSGSDRVADIAPFNRHISQFSDDGETFWGAYGPRIRNQLGGTIDRLIHDPYTRQAVIAIWRDNPPADTKDVPCTLMAQFRIEHAKTPRGEKTLHSHVVMRSSDAWLGLPYDVFNFSMLQQLVAGAVGAEPGLLTYTLMNGHLYDRDLGSAEEILIANKPVPDQPKVIFPNDVQQLNLLMYCRDAEKPLKEWLGLFSDVDEEEL